MLKQLGVRFTRPSRVAGLAANKHQKHSSSFLVHCRRADNTAALHLPNARPPLVRKFNSCLQKRYKSTSAEAVVVSKDGRGVEETVAPIDDPLLAKGEQWRIESLQKVVDNLAERRVVLEEQLGLHTNAIESNTTTPNGNIDATKIAEMPPGKAI
jgi:hypothetical protein